MSNDVCVHCGLYRDSHINAPNYPQPICNSSLRPPGQAFSFYESTTKAQKHELLITRLLPYCQHKSDCAKWEVVNSEDGLKVLVSDRRPCNCGLDEIKQELGE